MVAISGAVLLRPLQIPAIHLSRRRSPASALAPSRKVSVVAVALRRRRPRAVVDLARPTSAPGGGDLPASSRTAVTGAGGGHHHVALADNRPCALARRRRTASRPPASREVKAGAAGVAHQGADVLALGRLVHFLRQSTGARPTPWQVKTPAAVVPAATHQHVRSLRRSVL